MQFSAQLFQDKCQSRAESKAIMHKQPYVNSRPFPQRSRAAATAPGPHSCTVREGKQSCGRRVSVAMCSGSLPSGGCMAGWVLRADTALWCRSTAQAAPELPAEEYFVKSLYPEELRVPSPPPTHTHPSPNSNEGQE